MQLWSLSAPVTLRGAHSAPGAIRGSPYARPLSEDSRHGSRHLPFRPDVDHITLPDIYNFLRICFPWLPWPEVPEIPDIKACAAAILPP